MTRGCSCCRRLLPRTLPCRGTSACAGFVSSPPCLVAPPVRDRRSAIAAKCLRVDLHAGRRLTAFVLRPVDHRNRVLDDGAVEAVRGELLERAIVFDVLFEYLVELRVGRQGILVKLIVTQLGARGTLDDGRRDQLAPGTFVEVSREPEDVRLVD